MKSIKIYKNQKWNYEIEIEIRQENRKLLGDPFTTCEDPNETLLNHYAIYERKNCLTECLIIYIEKECGCKPALFPDFMAIDFQTYNEGCLFCWFPVDIYR